MTADSSPTPNKCPVPVTFYDPFWPSCDWDIQIHPIEEFIHCQLRGVPVVTSPLFPVFGYADFNCYLNYFHVTPFCSIPNDGN